MNEFAAAQKANDFWEGECEGMYWWGEQLVPLRGDTRGRFSLNHFPCNYSLECEHPYFTFEILSLVTSAATKNLFQLPHQTLGAVNPDAVAFALEGRGMSIVTQNVLEFNTGEIGLVFGNVKLGQLHFGARVGMILRDVLPV